MDPIAIATGAKIAKEAAGILTDTAKTVADISEQCKDGAARRAIESQKMDLTLFQGKAGILFDGINTAMSAVNVGSEIIKSQRDSQAQAANVYAEIERNNIECEKTLINLKSEMEIKIQTAQANILHQQREDEIARQEKIKAHEARIMELQHEAELSMKQQTDSHEAEMTKMRYQHEKDMEQLNIDRLNAEKAAEKVDAEIRAIDAAIENNRLYIKMLIETIKKLLQDYIVMTQTWELTPDNIQRIEMQRQALMHSLSQIQALPMKPGT